MCSANSIGITVSGNNRGPRRTNNDLQRARCFRRRSPSAAGARVHLSECSRWRLSLAGRGGLRCSKSSVVGAGPCRRPLASARPSPPHFVRTVGALAMFICPRET